MSDDEILHSFLRVDLDRPYPHAPVPSPEAIAEAEEAVIIWARGVALTTRPGALVHRGSSVK